MQAVTHIAAAGLYAAVALASGALQFVDLQKVNVPPSFTKALCSRMKQICRGSKTDQL